MLKKNNAQCRIKCYSKVSGFDFCEPEYMTLNFCPTMSELVSPWANFISFWCSVFTCKLGMIMIVAILYVVVMIQLVSTPQTL